MHTLQSILLITNNASMDLKAQFNIDGDNPNIDTYIAKPDPTIGIDDVRKIQSFSSRRPIKNDTKYIVIIEAQLLTVEAQNALLKILEEPPEYLTIILTAPHTHTFLETILSRCQTIRSISNHQLTKTEVGENTYLQPLLSTPPAARLKMIPADTKARQNALTYCQILINEAQQMLHEKPTIVTTENLEILMQCHTYLMANTNPTTTLTDAILRLQV